MKEESKDLCERLTEILMEANDQASEGKGAERHNPHGLPFEDQPICVIQRLLKGHAHAGGAYQVIKKVVEAGFLSPEKAKKEYLGAINYLGSLVIVTEEDEEDEEEPQRKPVKKHKNKKH